MNDESDLSRLRRRGRGLSPRNNNHFFSNGPRREGQTEEYARRGLNFSEYDEDEYLT